MAFCSNCGNKLKSTYKFCPKCGKKIQEEEVTLYEKAKDFVIENNKVSVALIQKEFKISASSATKIIKELETNGIVSSPNGRKGRIVLVNESEEEVCKDGFIDKTIKYITKIVNTKESSSKFDKKDIENNIFLAMLSYIGIFALVPYFIHNDSKYVKYHAVRGINLLIVEGIYVLLDGVFSLIDFCTDKISLLTNNLVDRLTNLVIGFGKKKYNNKEDE